MNTAKSLDNLKYSVKHISLGQKQAEKEKQNLIEFIEMVDEWLKERTWTQRKAAGYAGCDESTVWRHRKEGNLKSLFVMDVMEWERKYKPGKGHQ